MLAVYDFGASPVGSTDTVIEFNSPASVMFPVGLTRSHGAPCTASVAAVAAPVLDRTKLLVSAGLPVTGNPVVY